MEEMFAIWDKDGAQWWYAPGHENTYDGVTYEPTPDRWFFEAPWGSVEHQWWTAEMFDLRSRL